jgi:hypothetical protein
MPAISVVPTVLIHSSLLRCSVTLVVLWLQVWLDQGSVGVCIGCCSNIGSGVVVLVTFARRGARLSAGFSQGVQQGQGSRAVCCVLNSGVGVPLLFF